MINKKIDEILPSKILKDKNTDVKFKIWLKKEFKILNSLRLCEKYFNLKATIKKLKLYF
jgi:hypothetical protein